MKRIAGAIIALLILIGGFVAALPFFLSSDAVRATIITKLKEATGREVSFAGEPSVSLQPFLSIEISDLSIGDPNALPDQSPLLFAEQVRAELDLLPALLGNIEISKFRLIRPKISLKTYQDGFKNWQFTNGFIADKVISQPDSKTDGDNQTAKLGALEIEDGQIFYEDQISGSMEQITNVVGRFSWPRVSEGFVASGSGIWKGENVGLNLNISDLAGLVSGDGSDLNLDFKSTPLNISINGSANTIANLFITGEISASSPSVIRFTDFIGIKSGDLPGKSEWNIEGDFEGTFQRATISNAKIKLQDFDATGALNFAIDEEQNTKVDGTLAFETIDVAQFFIPLGEGQDKKRADNNTILDLRISANAMMLGPLSLNNVAATINTSKSEQVLDIGYSEAFEGTIIAKVTSHSTEGAPNTSLELTARGLQAQTLLPNFGASDIDVSGLLDIDANLNGPNTIVSAFTNALNGNLNISLNEGVISGINLPRMLGTQANTGSSRVALKGGRTPFSEIAIRTFVNDGIASISRANLKSGNTEIQVIGDVNLANTGIALRAQRVKQGVPEAGQLFIGGTLSAPLFSVKTNASANTAPKQSSQSTEPAPNLPRPDENN